MNKNKTTMLNMISDQRFKMKILARDNKCLKVTYT